MATMALEINTGTDTRLPRILIADGASFKGNVDMDVKGR